MKNLFKIAILIVVIQFLVITEVLAQGYSAYRESPAPPSSEGTYTPENVNAESYSQMTNQQQYRPQSPYQNPYQNPYLNSYQRPQYNYQNLKQQLPSDLRQYEESYYVNLNKPLNQNEGAVPNPSEIEKIYNSELQQFGYDMFGASSESSVSLSGLPTKNYVMNRGDRVKLYFWGDTLDLLKITGNSNLEPQIDAAVDADGNMFIPGVGVIFAEGRTVADLENEINSNLASKYTSVTAKMAVGSPGNMPIMVVGKVGNPGSVSVTPTSNFLDAIKQAGGILKSGSLRDIVYIDFYTKKKTPIDLYKLITKGDYPDIYLKEGDVILVRPIGKVIALADGVKNPAIYEFKAKETLQNVVGYAGGLLPSINTKSIEIERFDVTSGQKIALDLSLSDFAGFLPKDGDLLRLVPLYEQAENTVTLEGNVKHPRTIQYKEGMKLSDVLKSREELLLNTYTEQAVIVRVDGLNKGIVQIPISLSTFFNGATDPVLKPLDIIKVYSATKMGVIEVAGKVKNPAFIPYKEGLTLRDILNLITLDANPNEIVAEISNATDNNKDKNKTTLSAKINVKTVYLYELLTKNNTELNLKLSANDKVMFRPISEKETLKRVKISGFVNAPGTYNVKQGMRIIDVINMAGGLTYDAFLPGIVFLRPAVGEIQKKALLRSVMALQEDIALKVTDLQAVRDPSKKTDLKTFISNQEDLLSLMQQKAQKDYGRIVLNITSNDLSSFPQGYNIEVRDDDEIIIPNVPQQVVVMGEVTNQSALAYIPDMNPQFYIDQVGGLTKEANKKHAYIIKANGRTEHLKNLTEVAIGPGDSIIVPRKVRIPFNPGQTLKDVVGMAFQTAGTVFMINALR